MRPSRIFIESAGGGSTFKPYWALNKSESIGTGERTMYPRNNASPERIAIGQVILIANGTAATGVTITTRGQGGAETPGDNSAVYGADNTIYYTPSQAETNFTSFTIIASKASCISSSMTVITSAASTPGQVDLKSVQGTAQTANDNGLDINTLITQVGTAGAGLTNLGASGNNWNTVVPPTVSEFNARTIASADYTIVSDLGTVQTADHTAGIADIPTTSEIALRTLLSADYTIVSDLGTVQTGDHTSTISSIDSVTTAILIDTAQIGVAGAGLTDLATQASVNTIDSNVDAILVDTGTTIPARLTGIEGASFSGSTDSLEAIRDRGDSAWTTGGGGGGTGLTAAETRAALGLASANLDTQLTAATTATGFATPSQVATALTDIHLDKLFASNYDPSSKPGSATALLNELVENDGGVARYTVNALENGPSGSGSSAEVIAAAVFNTLQSEHKLAGTYGLYLQSNSGYVPASGHASGLTSETAPFNAYEYGQVIRANMKQDISAFTVFEIVIQPEQGSSKNASQLSNRPKGAIIASGSDVTVGTVDVTIGDVLYAANEYLQYTTKPDDLSHPGTWRVRGTVVKSAANKLLGDFLRFTVLD
jgi:hypothetical protein